jgi:hypothetical protein
VWERFACKDPLVRGALLKILALVRYPVRGATAVRVQGEEEPYSAAITVLLKLIFTFPRYTQE